MRTRTFIGMILLILALIVASNPMLLEASASGLHKLAAAAHVPGVSAPSSSTKSDAVAASADKQGTGKVDSRLELKGYLVGTPDLRDGYSAVERASLQGGRLGSGSQRQLMPGQLRNAAVTSDPVPLSDGVLLDSSGCPQFRQGVDITALMADPAAATLYVSKVAAADDPAACKANFDARIAAADPAQQPAAGTSAMQRRYSARELDSMELPDLLIELSSVEMVSAMFGLNEGANEAANTASDALR